MIIGGLKQANANVFTIVLILETKQMLVFKENKVQLALAGAPKIIKINLFKCRQM
jgi:hypothetical protein